MNKHRLYIVSVSFALALVVVSSVMTTFIQPYQISTAAGINTNRLFVLTNQARSQRNISSLTLNATLSRAAQLKAEHMFEHQYWAHNGPGDYTNFHYKTTWHWFNAVGYGYTFAGENLAIDFASSDAVFRGWMNSPTHQKNILDPHFEQIGFAAVDGIFEGKSTTIVVQLFGTLPKVSQALVDEGDVEGASDDSESSQQVDDDTFQIEDKSVENIDNSYEQEDKSQPSFSTENLVLEIEDDLVSDIVINHFTTTETETETKDNEIKDAQNDLVPRQIDKPVEVSLPVVTETIIVKQPYKEIKIPDADPVENIPSKQIDDQSQPQIITQKNPQQDLDIEPIVINTPNINDSEFDTNTTKEPSKNQESVDVFETEDVPILEDDPSAFSDSSLFVENDVSGIMPSNIEVQQSLESNAYQQFFARMRSCVTEISETIMYNKYCQNVRLGRIISGVLLSVLLVYYVNQSLVMRKKLEKAHHHHFLHAILVLLMLIGLFSL